MIVIVAIRILPESSFAVKVSACGPTAAPPPTFILKTTDASVVVIGSAGFGLMPPEASGGVTVTLPLNPAMRLILTVTRALVPRSAVNDEAI